MGILKTKTIKLSDVTMENFVLIRIISVVSGSNLYPLIGYLDTYSTVVLCRPG